MLKLGKLYQLCGRTDFPLSGRGLNGVEYDIFKGDIICAIKETWFSDQWIEYKIVTVKGLFLSMCVAKNWSEERGDLWYFKELESINNIV